MKPNIFALKSSCEKSFVFEMSSESFVAHLVDAEGAPNLLEDHGRKVHKACGLSLVSVWHLGNTHTTDIYILYYM